MAHISFFDLEDAFGSVPHSLIQETLKRNHLPENIQSYLSNFYSGGKAVIQTHNWRSEPFAFKRGVFQGDPLSGTIFLIVFNPLIEYIKTHKVTNLATLQSLQHLLLTTSTSSQTTVSNTRSSLLTLKARPPLWASLSSQANADHSLLCRVSRPTFHFIFPHRLQLTQ